MHGRLTIGMITGCTVQGLFDTLSAFHRAHPGIDITLVEDNSGPLIERVRSGELDLALIGTSGTPPSGLGALPITSERVVAAVPFSHPLAKQDRVLLNDVSDHPIVCMPEGTAPRTLFDRACAVEGIAANIVIQASAPDAVADLAA